MSSRLKSSSRRKWYRHCRKIMMINMKNSKAFRNLWASSRSVTCKFSNCNSKSMSKKKPWIRLTAKWCEWRRNWSNVPKRTKTWRSRAKHWSKILWPWSTPLRMVCKANSRVRKSAWNSWIDWADWASSSKTNRIVLRPLEDTERGLIPSHRAISSRRSTKKLRKSTFWNLKKKKNTFTFSSTLSPTQSHNSKIKREEHSYPFVASSFARTYRPTACSKIWASLTNMSTWSRRKTNSWPRDCWWRTTWTSSICILSTSWRGRLWRRRIGTRIWSWRWRDHKWRAAL